MRQSIFEGADIVLWGDQTHPTEVREDFIKDIDPRYEFEVGRNTDYTFHTGYQDSKFTKNQATTALGLMSRILLGYRRSHPFCIGSANKILQDQLPAMPKREGDWDGFSLDAQYPMYFVYYGTLSMHQMGGRYFREWNKRIKVILPATQRTEGCSRGSWPGWRLDGIFGSLYTTAMGALTLETLLPLRADPPGLTRGSSAGNSFDVETADRRSRRRSDALSARPWPTRGRVLTNTHGPGENPRQLAQSRSSRTTSPVASSLQAHRSRDLRDRARGLPPRSASPRSIAT